MEPGNLRGGFAGPIFTRGSTRIRSQPHRVFS